MDIIKNKNFLIGIVIGIILVLLFTYVRGMMSENLDTKGLLAAALLQTNPTDAFTDPDTKAILELIKYHDKSDPITTEVFTDPLSGKVKMMAGITLLEGAPTEPFSMKDFRSSMSNMRARMGYASPTEKFVDPNSGKTIKLASAALRQNDPTELFTDPITGKANKMADVALLQTAPTELFVDPLSKKVRGISMADLKQTSPTFTGYEGAVGDRKEDKRELPSLVAQLWS